MKDMGTITNFLGIQITKNADAYFMSQAASAKSILQNEDLAQCKPIATPTYTKCIADMKQKLVLTKAQVYRQIMGALQYLTITRPDIAYAINMLCQHICIILSKNIHTCSRNF
ncbi:putative mitochondrial protein [Dendrobium catenatum]|uniref:Putative mitochondrial protein n=1 Tax=Dendrobium catenatum TaxID=906689 RepID=A0A2I0VAP5_9ASPA|nr:putative mitochondrial protein [Dendrobium catenatum]